MIFLPGAILSLICRPPPSPARARAGATLVPATGPARHSSPAPAKPIHGPPRALLTTTPGSVREGGSVGEISRGSTTANQMNGPSWEVGRETINSSHAGYYVSPVIG